MVYRLILSYVGGAYAGWQRQVNALAVQQVVEEALGEILQQRVVITGAGRTDAGVHARGQVAHFELDAEADPVTLVRGTNHHLPADVRVLAAQRVREGFHARKSALAKEYRYRLTRTPVISPLDASFVVKVAPAVNVDRLRRGASMALGEHDFSAFALAGGAHSQPRRRVLSANWYENGPELEFRVVGDGFLRGMVRSLVGTLIEVGEGRRSADNFAELLEGAPRSEAGPTAPAHGLLLRRVFYAPGWAVRDG